LNSISKLSQYYRESKNKMSKDSNKLMLHQAKLTLDQEIKRKIKMLFIDN